MREITRTWRRTRRLWLYATLACDATSGPRALEVSIGIEVLGVAARVGMAEEAGGGCAGMCGGVAHACALSKTRPGEAGDVRDLRSVCVVGVHFVAHGSRLVAECV